jgi:hypothetical protein
VAKIRGRGKIGDVLRISLENGSFAYGRILDEPLMSFYDLSTRTEVSLSEILGSPVLFRVWVMNQAVKRPTWEIIGSEPLDDNLKSKPTFFKYDRRDKAFSLYRDSTDIPATRAQCIGLECAAVWNPEHIEDRLRDHFDGRPNKWVELLKP